MLNELVEFGRRIRKPEDNDALKMETVSIDIQIDGQGKFVSFNEHDKLPTLAEALASKKGQARLLLDKPEEVLGREAKKHALFLAKLREYQDVPSLAPVFKFYGDNKAEGLDKAAVAFEESVSPKMQSGVNLAFLLMGQSRRIHEKEDVVAAIIGKFAERQEQSADGRPCSICGSSRNPVLDRPHGMIKKVPDGQSSGSALVSYNKDAFESYGLSGNENSSICTVCARNYVEGLNYLLGNGEQVQPEKGKPYTKYSNRKSLAFDTAMIYWTREGQAPPELELLDKPQEREEDIFALLAEEMPDAAPRDDAFKLILKAPAARDPKISEKVDSNRFYAATLSGAAARIAIRGWIESTPAAVRDNIRAWFRDMAIMERDFESGQMKTRYFSPDNLAWSCGVHRKRETGGQARFELDREDRFLGQAAAMLWNCALTGRRPPRTLLDRVLRRIQAEQGRVTSARAALLKLILNRRLNISQTGGKIMQAQLDADNLDTAYLAGRIFAMLDSIQSAALGQNVNAPIRERFFSFASTSPATAFGRLLKMSQNHLGKLRGEKPGLAITLEKQLGSLFSGLKSFPTTFSLEEQGQFAIGYYHQRQDNFKKDESPAKKENDND